MKCTGSRKCLAAWWPLFEGQADFRLILSSANELPFPANIIIFPTISLIFMPILASPQILSTFWVGGDALLFGGQ